MEDKRSLGEYIAEHRRALGLTQRQFAERLYVTDSAVSKWERGLSYPDITLLHDICAVLGVTEHELLTASEDTEARRAGALARRYLRLLRGWKLGQAAAYGLAALVCFIADAAQDGALGWSWVVLASLMTAASLTLTPALAPERLGGVCTLGAFTLALELLLGVCCAYVGGDWFFVAGMSVLFGLGLLFLPYVLKRLPLPENVKTRRAALSLGLDLALLLGLLAVCCTHVDGDWFWITAVSVVYACSVLILPFVIRQLPLPGRLAEHRAALWLGVCSLLLFVLFGRGEALRRRGLVPTARSAHGALRSGAALGPSSRAEVSESGRPLPGRGGRRFCSALVLALPLGTGPGDGAGRPGGRTSLQSAAALRL